MKKVFFASALAAVVALASCNGGAKEETKTDSTATPAVNQDSIDKANADAEAAKVAEEAKAKATADSIAKADSLAKAKGGKPADKK